MPSSPTDKGSACGRTGEPYITDCDYDQAGHAARRTSMAQLRAEQLRSRRASSSIFDQQEFVRDLAGHGLDDAGVAYVPRACRRARAAACTSSSMAATSSASRSAMPSQGHRLCQLGRRQPPDRAVPAGQRQHAQPAGLLGLVGLHGPRVSDAQGAADHGRAAHAGPAGGTVACAAGDFRSAESRLSRPSTINFLGKLRAAGSSGQARG